MSFRFSFFILFSSLLIFSSQVLALDVPSLTGPVVDTAHLLSESGKAAIETALYDLNKNDGVQFQVLIVDKLLNESVEGYSIKVVDAWKLGKKGDDRAALFLIVVSDKKTRIEVGRGLEGSLTDLSTHRILDEVKPYFRKGDFDNGVALGLALMAQAAGKKLSFQGNIKPRHKRKGVPSFILFIVFGFIIFLQAILPKGRGRAGHWGGGGLGGGFGGGRSGGGGGSWSGGGGGFSGGGSSSDW